MKNKVLYLAITILVATFVNASAANAQDNRLDLTSAIDQNNILLKIVEKEKPATLPPPVVPKPIEYKIAPGDNLSIIAQNNNTTIARLWAKNPGLADPNQIAIEATILIPTNDETLADRPLPQAIVSTPIVGGLKTPTGTSPLVSAGNGYAYGYCTWYVKNRRSDLPNDLGNAMTWASRAQGYGFATGSTPRVGAVGQAGNHVVYVEQVLGNGSIVISEMNNVGWNVVNTRTASASSFTYIY